MSGSAGRPAGWPCRGGGGSGPNRLHTSSETTPVTSIPVPIGESSGDDGSRQVPATGPSSARGFGTGQNDQSSSAVDSAPLGSAYSAVSVVSSPGSTSGGATRTARIRGPVTYGVGSSRRRAQDARRI